MRATLASGEDSHVDAVLNVLRSLTVLAEENETGTGSTECLVAAQDNRVRNRISAEEVFFSKKTYVVVVTTSQYSKGLSSSPVATRPLVWAISAIKYAPCSSAVARRLL